MAFVFDPNPAEGDKQTNNETGVEYVYHLGAWRPLGPTFDSQFDDLDKRYLQLTGGELTGQLIMKKEETTAHEGLLIEGTLQDGTEGNLLRVYHNGGTTPDAISYRGRQENDSNIATIKYVNDHAGGTIHVGTSAPSDLSVGTMWFNTNDDTLNIKVS